MKINVVNYNPAWPDEFNSEKILLASRLGNLLDNIHHIGSTSVPGLAAKPIIDIILEVHSLNALDELSSTMNSLGYEAKGEFGLSNRRYFTKGNPAKIHHLHAYTTNDINVKRHTAFRDYLISHHDIMLEYAELKLKLALTWPNDMELYIKGKDNFIKHYESVAMA